MYLGSWRDLLYHDATVLGNFSDASKSLHSDLLVCFVDQPVWIDEGLDARIRACSVYINA